MKIKYGFQWTPGDVVPPKWDSEEEVRAYVEEMDHANDGHWIIKHLTQDDKDRHTALYDGVKIIRFKVHQTVALDTYRKARDFRDEAQRQFGDLFPMFQGRLSSHDMIAQTETGAYIGFLYEVDEVLA